MARGLQNAAAGRTLSVLPFWEAWQPLQATSHDWHAELFPKLKPWPAQTFAGKQDGHHLSVAFKAFKVCEL